VTEHLRINADLVILRIVLVDGEVVFGEEGKQIREKPRGEIELAQGLRLRVEQTAIQVKVFPPGSDRVKR
jgi:hypothetical protein